MKHKVRLTFVAASDHNIGTGHGPVTEADIAAVATLYGFNLGDAAEANVAKLRGRFPDGFSFKAAADRADEKVAPVCTCPPLSGYERPELTGHERRCPVWASRADEGGTK